MQAYRRLSVWRKSHELTLRMYAQAESVRFRFPTLAQQMIRAAQRIPATIAEGQATASGGQFSQYLDTGIRSAAELDYALRLAVDLGAITMKDHAMLEARTDEVRRMLVGLRHTVTRPRTAQGVPRPPIVR